MPAKNIDQVIQLLEQIIEESKTRESTMGYFAALYLGVTQKVKEGIAQGFFEDGPRMERLDVIFANRYLTAYFDYQKNKPVSLSWVTAFEMSTHFWPTVLQHLLLGMNAHINLDLGIAAAEVMKGQAIGPLRADFNKINEILSSLVGKVEEDLSMIWPTLKKILKFTKNADDFLLDFSMELARDGAWRFAESVRESPDADQALLISEKDRKVSNNVHLIISNNLIIRPVFGIIRLGERGGVVNKIEVMCNR